MGMGDPTAGEPFMLESLVPVLVGGTSLMGGKGGLMGTLAGVLILTVLNNSLNLLDVSGYWQWVVQGVIIVIAVAFYVKKKVIGTHLIHEWAASILASGVLGAHL